MWTRRGVVSAMMLAPATAAAVTPEEFRRMLREALAAEPSILRDALVLMQEAEQREREQAMLRALQEYREELFSVEGEIVIGNPTGAIRLVEFYDVRCGFCRQMHPIVKEVAAAFPDLAVIMRGYPILGDGSRLAEQAIRAAHMRGLGREFLDAFIEGPPDITLDVVRGVVQRFHINWLDFRGILYSDDVQMTIERSLDLGRRLMVGGTPAFFIGERMIPGAVPREALEGIVREEKARLDQR